MAPELLRRTDYLVARVRSRDHEGQYIRPTIGQRLRTEAALMHFPSFPELD
jgi:hypothetical protein